MIEIVLGVLRIARDTAELCDLGEGYYQFPAARLEIDSENARILRSRVVCVRIGQSGVSVTAPHILDPAKIRCHSGATVGADSINRMGQSPLLAAVDIEYMTYKTTILPGVPDNLVFRARSPLEHTTLLPAPRTALAQLSPGLAAVQIHHPDLDDIVGPRAAMLEIHLHPEHISAGRIELELVVVAEPMEFRPAGDGPDSRGVF